MPANRLHTAAAPLARAACLLIAPLILSACGGRTAPPETQTPSTNLYRRAAIVSSKASVPGAVTLSWTPPSQNVDGTPLQDLAGYHVYYSQAPWGWNSSLNVPDPNTTKVQIANLSTGTWYFTVAAYNAAGAESERTGTVSKML